MGVIETSSDQSLFGPEVPSSWGVTTVASKNQDHKQMFYLLSRSLHKRQVIVPLWSSVSPLTPCHSCHSRSTGPQRRSPRWPEHCCGCTRGQRWPLLHQMPESRKPLGSTTTSSSRRTRKNDIYAGKTLTQQDPQEPWSLISLRVGQLGHCTLESNSLGSFTSPAYWTLQK